MKPVKKIDDVLLIEDEVSNIRDAISAKASTGVNWAQLSSAVIQDYGDDYLEFAYLAHKLNQTKIEPTNKGAKEIKQNLFLITKTKQKILFAVGLFLITATLFPPFLITAQGVSISQGFKFIISSGSYQGVVNIPLLLCEIGVILIVGIIGLILVTNEVEKSEQY
jgi:hypothetical protein